MSSNESESDHEPKIKKTFNTSNYKRNVIEQCEVKGVKHTNWYGREVQSIYNKFINNKIFNFPLEHSITFRLKMNKISTIAH